MLYKLVDSQYVDADRTFLGQCVASAASAVQWLMVHQRIDYKLAVLTYKVRSTGTPSYLSHHIKPRISTRHLRSSLHLLLQKLVSDG